MFSLVELEGEDWQRKLPDELIFIPVNYGGKYLLICNAVK